MSDRLTLNTFAAASNDAEGCQYRILAGLKLYYEEFASNRLYPSLAELIDLVQSLEQVVQNTKDLESHFPHAVTGIDLKKKVLLTEPDSASSGEVERFLEVVRWAIPVLRKAITEGTDIYDFVDEHVALSEVGILPIQQDEGYAIVPDNRQRTIQVIRYELSLFEQGEERFRAMRTRVVKSLPQGELVSEARSIKLDIVREHPDLPNPAMFEFLTDLAFPFAETILPVAKRKLMARLAA